MTLKVVPSDYVSVRVAAERSGYTRAHIHNLANWKIISSELVTPNFRLVNWPDIVAYMEAHPRKRTQPAASEEAP